MPLPPNFTNTARRDALEARVTALETGGGGGGPIEAADITDSTTIGRALLTAPNAAAARSAAGAAAASHGHASADIADATAVGLALMTAADAAAARTAIGAGTGGGGGPIGDRVLYVYAQGESGATGSYICDGTADEVQINAALAELSNAGTFGDDIDFGTVGGTVVLVGRRFTIAGPILMRTQTRLTSMYGEHATQVRCHSTYAPGNTGGMIQLYTDDVQYTQVDHLLLDGQGYSVGGIYYVQDAGQEYDSYHKLYDLYIWNCGHNSGAGDGISMQNNSGGRLRGNHLRNIRILNAGRYGVYVNGPDSFYENIDSGSAGSHGFYITHANNRFVGCKSWYSDGSGFHLTTASRDNQFSACESQDNLMHGYHIQGARNSFSSCCADSNSFDGSHPNSSSVEAITGRTYHGFNILGNYTCVVGCTASDKNESGRGARQVYGVYIGSGVSCIVKATTTGNYTGSLSDNSSATRDVTVIGT